MSTPRKSRKGEEINAISNAFLSPSKAKSKAVESKITPVKKRRLDIAVEEDRTSTTRRKVIEEEENCRCPENLPLLRLVSTAIEISEEGLSELKLKDLRNLQEALRDSMEIVISTHGTNLSAEEVKKNRSKARSLIEKCTKDRKMSIVASIVCDYVDNGKDDIGYLQHLQKTGDPKGFRTMVPTWSWMGKSLTSLYELGLSRFR